jgi:hypothetical protein
MHHDFYVNDQVLFLIIFLLHHVTFNLKKKSRNKKKKTEEILILLNINLANVNIRFQLIMIEKLVFDIVQAYLNNKIVIIYSNLLVVLPKKNNFIEKNFLLKTIIYKCLFTLIIWSRNNK